MQPNKHTRRQFLPRMLFAAALLLVATTGAFTHAHLDAGVDSECVACSFSGHPPLSAPLSLAPPAPSARVDAPRPLPEAKLPASDYQPNPARGPPVAH